MSWWSRIFGEKGLPERERGPSAPTEGAMKNGKKHGLWIERDEYDFQLLEVIYKDGVREGPFRQWHRDTGALRLSGCMVAGEQHGTVEAWHEGAVRYRCEKVAGKLHGKLVALKRDGTVEYEREYRNDTIWSGPYDIESDPGVYIQRAMYIDGKRVGAYEDNDWNGRPKLRAHYVDGKLDGEYRAYHEGGILKLEGTYAMDARVGTWRWRDRDGNVIAESTDGTTWRASGFEIPARDEDDIAKWIELARAWAALPGDYWFHVESAVDKFEDKQPAVAWLEARIAERDPAPHRTTLGMGWIEHVVGSDDDPRAKLVDGISVDHHGWEGEQVARIVRKAPMMRELSMYECYVEPCVDALFPEGVAWPKLEELYIGECESLGALVERLASATWTGKLAKLTLDDNDGGISGAHAAALVSSPHLTALRELALHNVGDGFVAALETSPLLARLERLELHYPAELDAILATLARCAMPELRELEIRGSDATITHEVLLGLTDTTLRPKLESIEMEGFERSPKKTRAQIKKTRPQLELRIDRY